MANSHGAPVALAKRPRFRRLAAALALAVGAAIGLPISGGSSIASALSTTITLVTHNAHDVSVSSTTVGAAVHASVSLSGIQRPTGTITIYRYSDGACAGKGAASKPVPLVDGRADVRSFPFLPTSAGTFAFGAFYQPAPGSQYTPAHACRAFTVLRATPGVTITFRLHGDGIVTSVEANQMADIVTTVVGPTGVPVPTGQVTVRVYTDSGCTVQEWTHDWTLAGGSATFSQRRPAPATRWYRAFYNGDSRYTSSKSGCSRLAWTKATPTLNGSVHDAGHVAVTSVVVGTAVHAFIRVRGFIVEEGGETIPTGPVRGTWYSDSGCTQLVESFGPVVLESGQVEITESTRQWPLGAYGLRLQYLGNAVYKSAVGACLPLTVRAAATAPPTAAPTPHPTATTAAVATPSVPAGTTAPQPSPGTPSEPMASPSVPPGATASPVASAESPPTTDTGQLVDPLALIVVGLLVIVAIGLGFAYGRRRGGRSGRAA